MNPRLTSDDLDRDYYELLGLAPRAPEAIIRAACRTLMDELGAHPDAGGSHDRAALINRAQEILLDPALRSEYDRLRRPTRSGTSPAGPRGFGGATAGAQTTAGARPAPAPSSTSTRSSPEDQQRAEQRVREEMVRHRRQEEAQLKTFKVGCISILVAMVLALVIAFFL